MMNNPTGICDQSLFTTLQVQHDDGFVDDVPSHPYHTRFFDVVVLTSSPIVPIAPVAPIMSIPPLPLLTPVLANPSSPAIIEQNSSSSSMNIPISRGETIHHKNSVSIMSYEDAIVNAISELRDLCIGSSVHEIKKHMTSNFMKSDNYLMKSGNRSNSSSTHTKTVRVCFVNHNKNDNEIDNNNQQYIIKNSLFLAALKSLLNRKVIVPCASFVKKSSLSSCCFKLSRKYVKERVQILIRHKLLSKEKYNKEKEYNYWKKRNKYAKERVQKIPTVRIKPPLSKIRLIDPNKSGMLVERSKKRDNNNNYRNNNNDKMLVSGMMDMDGMDEETQERFIFLLKLGLHMKKVFIAKRKNVCKKKNLHYKKIVSTY